MKYIYHYHAFKQVAVGSLMHADGIITALHAINSMERYTEAKKGIAEQNPTLGDEQGWTIGSLTLLSESTS